MSLAVVVTMPLDRVMTAASNRTVCLVLVQGIPNWGYHFRGQRPRFPALTTDADCINRHAIDMRDLLAWRQVVSFRYTRR